MIDMYKARGTLSPSGRASGSSLTVVPDADGFLIVGSTTTHSRGSLPRSARSRSTGRQTISVRHRRLRDRSPSAYLAPLSLRHHAPFNPESGRSLWISSRSFA
jgi:hypothetical protein